MTSSPLPHQRGSDVLVQSEQQTAAQIGAGRRRGAQIAKELVADIQGMGLPAVEASELSTAVEGYLVTAQGLRKLGSGTVQAGGSKTPGAALGDVVAVASGNPVGLIVSSGMKVYGEASGKSKLEGRAKATAGEIADQLKIRFQEQGWIA